MIPTYLCIHEADWPWTLKSAFMSLVNSMRTVWRVVKQVSYAIFVYWANVLRFVPKNICQAYRKYTMVDRGGIEKVYIYHNIYQLTIVFVGTNFRKLQSNKMHPFTQIWRLSGCFGKKMMKNSGGYFFFSSFFPSLFKTRAWENYTHHQECTIQLLCSKIQQVMT